MVKNNFTRKDLSNKIYQSLGFSKNISSTIIDNFFETLIQGLLNSNKINVLNYERREGYLSGIITLLLYAPVYYNVTFSGALRAPKSTSKIPSFLIVFRVLGKFYFFDPSDLNFFRIIFYTFQNIFR